MVDEIIETLVRQYRIEPEDAEKTIETVFSASKNLQKVLEKESEPDKIKRTRAFKEALAAIKQKTYYGLRRYNVDNTIQLELIERLESSTATSPKELKELAKTLAALHTSTKERIQDADEFYGRLFELIDTPRTILDVGSGMQPLVFPFDSLENEFDLYLAADKDRTSISAINAYVQATAEKRLKAINWDIKENWEPLLSYNDNNDFHVAFLFKLVPVVERQNTEFLQILKKTPAKIWVVTGSKISLTKNKSIERRERATIRRFIELTGSRIIAEFSVSEEFGFVLENK